MSIEKLSVASVVSESCPSVTSTTESDKRAADQAGAAVPGVEDNDTFFSSDDVDARVYFARECAADISEVVMLLAVADPEDLSASVLQMVQQRIHELALGVVIALRGREELWQTQLRVHPSRLPPKAPRLSPTAPAVEPANGSSLRVTRAEYARMRGVPKSTVSRAVKRGSISLVDKRIEVESADAWFATSRGASGRVPRPASSEIAA